METNKQIAKVGAISAPVVVAGTLLVAQIFAVSIITDLLMSALVFGAGYATCYFQKKKGAG